LVPAKNSTNRSALSKAGILTAISEVRTSSIRAMN
jgi:hypothetical protein